MTDESERTRGRARELGVLLFTLLLTACDTEYLQSTIKPVTDYGEISHDLYVTIFWWSMVILAVVWGLLAYILIRFREKPGGDEPKQIHGHMGLEIAWTIAPALIVVAIVIPTIKGVFQVQRAPEGDDVLVVEVVGKRYWWSFHYPEQGVTTANELHLPVGRPVSLRLESGDVIHSFWVPQIGGKRDVNPVAAVPEGKEEKRNWMHFTLKEEGVFWGQCAEFCGEAHALMGVRVVARSPEEFEGWVETMKTPAPTAAAPDTATPAPSAAGESTALAPDESPQGPPGATDTAGSAQRQDAAGSSGTGAGSTTPAHATAFASDSLIDRGREVFFQESYCVLCHAIEGTAAAGQIGPNLTRMGMRTTLAAGLLENNPGNLVAWLKDPRGVKPGAQMPGADYPVTYEGQTFPPTNLSDEQIRALAAYLSSMK